MLTGLIGQKLRMTQIWNDKGDIIPVTVIRLGPCRVLQIKTSDGKDGYEAVQVGFDELPRRKTRHSKEWYASKGRYTGNPTPRGSKAIRRHVQRWGGEDAFRVICEVQAQPGVKLEMTVQKGNEGGDALRPGLVLNASVFSETAHVDVIGTSKGKGFQGCIKRHHFGRGPSGHGSKNVREPGSTGMCQTPGRVIKGKKMPGQMGAKRRTVRNLEVVKIEPELDLLYVRGGIPGPTGGYVLVRKSILERAASGGKAKQ